MFTTKKAQELPGWAYVVGLVIAVLVIILIIWIAIKSGRASTDQLTFLQ